MRRYARRLRTAAGRSRMSDIGAALLYAYVAITAMIAARAAWDMAFRLDAFDWHYGEIWPSFTMLVILWPLFLLKPRALVKMLRSPFSVIDRASPDLATRERELYLLSQNPPPCGQTVRFHHDDSIGGGGAFLEFSAEEVEQVLTDTSSGVCNPDVLLWVNRRRQDLPLTDVPRPWWRFQYIAAELIDKGHGVSDCIACGHRSPATELHKETISIIGHGFASWRCSCGAVALTVDTIQVHLGSPRGS